MPSYQPKRYLIAFATIPNNTPGAISVPVVFIENSPIDSLESAKVVGQTLAYINIPKFKKFEFEGNNRKSKKDTSKE